MNVKSNYLFLGIFVIVLGIGLIYGVYWLSRVSDDVDYTTYRIYFSESVSGLSEKSPVKYNGVRVGYVDKIEIDQVNFRQIILTVQVASDTPVTDATYATIISQGITGLAYIGLKTLVPYGNKIQASPNEEYPVIKSSPSLFVEIDQAINQATINLKSLVTRIEGVLDDENQQNFKNMLKNFDIISAQLSNKMQALDRNFEKFDMMIDNISKLTSRMPNFIENAEKSLIAFNKTSLDISKSTKYFNNTMDGTSRLITDVNHQLIPLMSKTMESLEQALANFNSLSRELQEEPSMLVRGRDRSRVGPGEGR
ncbi:MAG: MCE family protein [Legionellales bacterium]|nr:MCE family protein [Legionellales bacterium]